MTRPGPLGGSHRRDGDFSRGHKRKVSRFFCKAASEEAISSGAYTFSPAKLRWNPNSTTLYQVRFFCRVFALCAAPSAEGRTKSEQPGQPPPAPRRKAQITMRGLGGLRDAPARCAACKVGWTTVDGISPAPSMTFCTSDSLSQHLGECDYENYVSVSVARISLANAKDPRSCLLLRFPGSS